MIRRLWDRLFKKPAPVVVEVIEPSPTNVKIAAHALEKFAAGKQPDYGYLVHRRELKVPELPRGVIGNKDEIPGLGPYIALDHGMPNGNTASAFSFTGGGFNCGLGFPGYAYLAELAQRSEYRAPSEVIANEMTREFIKLSTAAKPGEDNDDEDNEDLNAAEGTAQDAFPPPKDKAKPKPAGEQLDEEDKDAPGEGGDEDKIEEIEQALKDFGVREAFRAVAWQDGIFGRSQIYIDLKDQESDERRALPLLIDSATIKKGSLRGFKVIEPIWTSPFTYNADDPTNPDFFKPKAWFVMGKRTHATRLLTFVSREVPDLLKAAYNFGGISMTQLMEPYVNQWLRTRNSVADLIHNFSVMILKTDMQATLAGDVAGTDGTLARAKVFTLMRDNQGLTLLNKDSEEMEQIAVPLSGLDSLQAQAQEHMAAPTHIPLVKLLGITPQGLNASSEGEIKVFYDFVKSQQESLFRKHLTTVVQIIQLHLYGEIDEAIDFQFVPLSSPTQKELSEIRKSDADAAVAYINSGVVAPEEERERLMGDPNSGYDNLHGDAPEPPMPDLPPGFGGEEGGEKPPGGEGGEKKPAPFGGAKDGRTTTSYKGYLIDGPSSEGLYYVSKGGHHITSRKSIEEAKKDIDGLV